MNTSIYSKAASFIKSIRLLALLSTLCAIYAMIFVPGITQAAVPEESIQSRTAVVIVSEGSELEEARTPLLSFEQAVQEAYPKIPVLRAFTNSAARNVVRGTVEDTPSLPGALSILEDTGYTQVVLLPTHTLPDQGTINITQVARSFETQPGGLRKIAHVLPLLGSEEDAYDVAAILMDTFPLEPKSGEAVVFVGKEIEDGGSLAYPALSWALFRQGKRGSLYLVATAQNEESLKDCVNILKMNKMKTVKLVPLVTVPDEYTQDLIYGKSAESFASRLSKESFEIQIHREGLASNEAIVALWRAKLQKMLDSMN
ncbi:sirohydrochlorin cobaltochelatase [Desulfovibrio sp. OttesenSCG-928-C06]|nr:sirohydrochlorin cobaltochelatase [Desulfovibrio sp. OttesenSCG-928-C06]